MLAENVSPRKDAREHISGREVTLGALLCPAGVILRGSRDRLTRLGISPVAASGGPS